MSELWVSNSALAAEQFDREIIIIDIEKGLYFSLRGAAVDLWLAFAEPRKVDDVEAALRGAAENADATLIAAAIEAMRFHALIVPAGEVSAAATPLPEFADFELPSIEVFDDLAELIAIDPVHEVDAEEGWPVRPKTFPSPTS